ncbi:MAG: YggS family pyridoxal phosphate-dependent enzyme [Nitrospinota bacterium]
MGLIAHNLEQVQHRMAEASIRAGRDPSSVKLVAVTKTVSPEKILEAFSCGAEIFGENRVQESLEKVPLVEKALGTSLSGRPGPRWHMVGHLQRNKARLVIGTFELIHSVDSLALIEELEKRAAARGARMKALLQVNVAGEAPKSGCRPEEVEGLAIAVENSPHLDLEGLMTMPPLPQDAEESRPWFRKVRELRDRLVDSGRGELRELSMGMTADFEVAIEEGATLVRIGSAIFGPRD